MGDAVSPESSRPTSPDLLGYTTAGEEVADDSGSTGSSNDTILDFSPPELRPRASTFPKARPVRQYTQPPPRDSRGRFVTRQNAIVIGESDDSQVGSGADLLERSVSPSWDGLGEQLLDDTAVAREWSIATQHDVALQPLADGLSVVPEGRESAETTMEHQEENVVEQPAVVPPTMAAQIEDRQDEAEEVLLSINVLLMSVAGPVTAPALAKKAYQRVEDATAALTKCHIFLRRRDRENHAADLGPRITAALERLGTLYAQLAEILSGAPADPVAPIAAAPAGPPPVDLSLIHI